MFANLRQGSQVYILHKTSTPYVEIGTIESVSNMPMIGYYPNMPTLPIDITVRVGDKVAPYKQLPANAEIANGMSQSGDEVTLACNKEAISNEVLTMKQKSIEAINSVAYHKQRIEVCERLYAQINPEVAEKKQQQEELSDLRGQVSTLTTMVERLTRELGVAASSSKNKDYEYNDSQDPSQ